MELPELVHQLKDGIPFAELYRIVANTTPATAEHIKEAAHLLAEAKELEIVGPNGERRRKATRITDADILRVPRQKIFSIDRADLLKLKRRKD